MMESVQPDRRHARARARPYLRVHHGQDQRRRPDPADAAVVVPRLHGRVGVCPVALRVADVPRHTRRRNLGQQPAGRVGVRHHELCLVDRYRSRRHADLGDPAVVQADVADIHQPLRRGDDAVCRCLRGHLSAHAHRAALVGVLALPVSEHHDAVAAVQEPAHLGRVRGLDLRAGVAVVLVRRVDPRRRHAARPRDHTRRPHHLRHDGDGVARLGPALAPLRDRLPPAGGPRDSARRLGPLGRELGLRRLGDPRLARHHLPALLRRRRHLLRLRDGADPHDSDSRAVWFRGFHHDAPSAEHGEGDAGHRLDRRLRIHDRSLHGLVQPESVRELHDVEPHDRAVLVGLRDADRSAT